MATTRAPKVKMNKAGFITEFDGSAFGIENVKVLHAWPTRDGLNVISINTFKGVTNLDVRQFYRDDERTNDKWMPTQKGVRISADVFSAIVSDSKRIEKLIKEAKE